MALARGFGGKPPVSCYILVVFVSKALWKSKVRYRFIFESFEVES
jgi:hypothetical protein